jgi:hypothetical protein
VAPATTLASLIAQTPGTPCVFGAFTGTGAGGVALSSGTGTHSNWSWTTLNIGTIGSAPTVATANLAASYFTSNTYIRVGFPVGSGQVANYYSCKQNYAGGSENCTQIGAGTYTTTTVSDANVLSLQGVPEQPTSGLTYNRVFVERGGQIFYGYKNKLSNSQAARLNLTATNFVFGLLGIPAIPTP